MANDRVVMAKIKQLHHKMGGGAPRVSMEKISHELQITKEAVGRSLTALSKLRFINVDKETMAVQLTKEGLAK